MRFILLAFVLLLVAACVATKGQMNYIATNDEDASRWMECIEGGGVADFDHDTCVKQEGKGPHGIDPN